MARYFFTMSIDIKSPFDTGTDYSIMLSKTPFSYYKNNWVEQLRELSATNKIRVLNQKDINII